MPGIDDTAVVVPATGHFFLNTSGTDPWTWTQVDTFRSAGTIPGTWVDLGHTDLDTPMAWDQDGGDTEVKGSFQNPSLRQVLTSATVDKFTIPAEQILDNTILNLYYGGGDASVANQFDVPDSPAAIEKSFMGVLIDGAVAVGIGVPKVSIIRADNLSVDPQDFLKAPLLFTVLKASGKPRIRWVNDKIGA
jgi:hypothetical protein